MTKIRPASILFLCATNSTCSIIAEALANHLGRGAVIACSAGPRPKSMVDPETVRFLESGGLPTTGLHSKSWDEFGGPKAPSMDFIVTIGKFPEARTRRSWPGHPVLIRWPVADPEGTEGVRLQRGLALVAETLQLRIRLLLSLQFYRDTRGRLHLGGLDNFASLIEAAAPLTIRRGLAHVP